MSLVKSLPNTFIKNRRTWTVIKDQFPVLAHWRYSCLCSIYIPVFRLSGIPTDHLPRLDSDNNNRAGKLAVPTSKNSSRGIKQQPDESASNSNNNNNNNRNRIANQSSNRKQESQPSTQKSPTLYDYHDIYPSQAVFAIDRSSNQTSVADP
jgi:hypothetical protein